MTSIDKFKKINDMTKVLKSHGFKTEEAVQTSSSLYGGIVKDTPPELKQKAQAEAPSDDTLKHFDRKHKQIETRLSSVESSVSTIIEKMNEMIKVITELEKRPAHTVLQKTEPKQEAQQTLPKEESKPKPRTGNYNPEQIDIMDYFNFSKK